MRSLLADGADYLALSPLLPWLCTSARAIRAITIVRRPTAAADVAPYTVRLRAGPDNDPTTGVRTSLPLSDQSVNHVFLEWSK